MDRFGNRTRRQSCRAQKRSSGHELFVLTICVFYVFFVVTLMLLSATRCIKSTAGFVSPIFPGGRGSYQTWLSVSAIPCAGAGTLITHGSNVRSKCVKECRYGGAASNASRSPASIECQRAEIQRSAVSRSSNCGKV